MQNYQMLTIGRPPEADYYVQNAIDRLRTNVGFSGSDKKVIMITSSVPNEGKSYVASSLWLNLAKSGKKVLFVDLDLRKSNLRNTLRISCPDDFRGMSHYLAGLNKIDEVVYKTNVDNAFFVPTMTLVNPSLLLEGNMLKTFIETERNEYDYVILDTPPLTLVSDGLQIGKLADCCILVSRAHTTPRSSIQESLSQLESIECPLLGVVLNRVSEKHSNSKYYSNNYYYSKYYSNDKSGAHAKRH